MSELGERERAERSVQIPFWDRIISPSKCRRPPGYVRLCKRACVRGIAAIAELELALKTSLGMSEQYRLRWQDVSLARRTLMTVRYSHLAPKHTLAAVEQLDAPKGNELTPLPTPASFSNQEAERLSCSKLLNQIDLQAKSRSGGMADAADSKSVGRKPVKVRLLSPAPISSISKEFF
jgi:hypothetical protein